MLSGPAAYGLYKLAVLKWPDLAFALYGRSEPIAEILITVSITFMGFLATIITILFGLSSSRAFARYRGYRYHQVFFSLYYLSLLCLGSTAAVSLGVFSRSHGRLLFPWMIMLAASSFVQVVVVTWIIVSQLHKYFNEISRKQGSSAL